MEHPLFRRLCQVQEPTPDNLLSAFLEYTSEKGLELYSAQEEAILAVFEGKNVILNTPTGSGKSLVAAALHFMAAARGRVSVYTCPIKALVNEKFLALCRDFAPENVGISTGDATVNRSAPILCCTAEILANIALAEGSDAKVRDVVMDEFHYYNDRERGVAWQVPMLTLPQCRFLLISATMGNAEFFARELTALNGIETVIIRSETRPVPLEFSYTDEGLDKVVEQLVVAQRAPVYVVHFTQMDAAQTAQDLLSVNFCSKEEKAKLAEATASFRFTSPFGPDIKKLLRHGIGLHHAGLLPKYRVLVEQLAQQGLLKLICGTDTLGVGVNVPIRTVLLTKLSKYDGQKTALLTARDFHQISGRAGRKGFDNIGYVVAQAPEHIVENKRLEKKAAGDEKKLKKIVKKKPPEGFVGWSEETFQRLIQSKAEPLASRFLISHGMLLNVLSRPGDGCMAMRNIINRSHETHASKKQLRARAFQLFRALVDRGIIQIRPRGATEGEKLRVNVALQEDFSLNQVLSLYLMDTIKLIDPASPDYALDVVTLAESILEDPDIIIRRQLDRVKSAKMAELKAEGMAFEERVLKLEECEHPKPKREFIYETFNEFARTHPWVGQENIRPKSIAREMCERFMSFSDYIRDYELQKVEGVLLRHLSSVFKVLQQTVPPAARTSALEDITAFLQSTLRSVDSSLLDEWQKMRDPSYQPRAESAEPKPESDDSLSDITRDENAFVALVRGRIFPLLRSLDAGYYEGALEHLDTPLDSEGVPWTPPRLAALTEVFLAARTRIRFDPDARQKANTLVSQTEDKKAWIIEQILVDPENHNDWTLRLKVDRQLSRDAGSPQLQLLGLAEVLASREDLG